MCSQRGPDSITDSSSFVYDRSGLPRPPPISYARMMFRKTAAGLLDGHQPLFASQLASICMLPLIALGEAPFQHAAI